jgi:2-oxoglutarate dehydrogenase E1 component
MTGQDVERGTFSHRHLVLNDQKTGAEYTPLHHLPTSRASFAIYNSPLSEMAALGFEYGYTRHAPGTLVMWEAQFGDFANSAQVMIDQFIVAGYAKWRQTPTLVLLLPHGYEGQGPEHSSARLERYLQLCANDNIRVVNPTTAAQHFHLLRRQAALLELAPRPLIVMTPKSLLRNPRAASSLRDLTDGSFQPVLYDDRSRERPRDVTRLVFCSGKVYVDLVSKKEYEGADGLAVVRLEELYPFPSQEIEEAVRAYPNVQEVAWLQEEPRNMGAWTYAQPRISELLDGRWKLRYIGRPESAAPAEGSLAQHAREQNRILTEALSGIPQPARREEVSSAR